MLSCKLCAYALVFYNLLLVDLCWRLRWWLVIACYWVLCLPIYDLFCLLDLVCVAWLCLLFASGADWLLLLALVARLLDLYLALVCLFDLLLCLRFVLLLVCWFVWFGFCVRGTFSLGCFFACLNWWCWLDLFWVACWVLLVFDGLCCLFYFVIVVVFVMFGCLFCFLLVVS